MLQTIEKLANLKGIVALLLVIVLLIFVWRNFDVISEISLRFDRDSGEVVDSADSQVPEERGGIHTPAITLMQMSPVRFALPNYFLLAIQNDELTEGRVDIYADFGSASIHAIEARPSESFGLTLGDSGQSVLRGHFEGVRPQEVVYLYVLLSHPTLDRLLVRGNGRTIEKTSEDLASIGRRAFVTRPMITWYRFLFVVVTTLFIGFAVLLIFGFFYSMANGAEQNSEGGGE